MKLHNLPWQRSVRLSGAKMAKKIQIVMNEDVKVGHLKTFWETSTHERAHQELFQQVFCRKTCELNPDFMF